MNITESTESEGLPLDHLSDLTVWPTKDETTIWKSALAVAGNPRGQRGGIGLRVWSWSMPKSIAAAIMIVLGAAVLMSLFFTSQSDQQVSVGLPNGVAHSVAMTTRSPSTSITQNGGVGKMAVDRSAGFRGGGESSAGVEGRNQSTGGLVSAAIMQNYYDPGVVYGPAAQSNQNAEAALQRRVVRKAQMELLAENVRSAFLKAQHTASAASGEFVQESALTGTEEDKNLQASLTLRVSSERLSTALNDLRSLGSVIAESSSGEDVTTTIVDLEARISNERRVEKELLELMEKRTDAPLKEILELRDKISQVRQYIEQMAAQRERLGRLVSLATVLVIIRSEPEEQKPASQPEEKSIGQYFGESLGAAWNNGLVLLADTIARLVRVFVGGVIWWIVFLLAIVVLRQHLRRRQMNAAVRA